jgi:hypothetical protein
MTADREHLQRHAERIRDEGQGVWQIAIYSRSDFAAMIAAANTGHRHAQQVLDVACQLIAAALDASADALMLCLTCDTAFDIITLPEAVVLVHAWRDDADHALAHGLCPTCCQRWNRSERETAVTDTLRRLLISDLKRVQISNPSGNA